MHGTVAAVTALQKADLLVALGARFDDRVTGKLSSFAPDARSSTPTSTRPRSARTAPPTCRSWVTPARRSRSSSTRSRAEQRGRAHAGPDRVVGAARRLARALPAGLRLARRTARSSPQYVIERLGAIAGPDAIYVAGVGQHQMWAAQFISYEKPGTWLNSGGLGTMGYAVPAAMGAKVGRPGHDGLGHRRRRLLPDDQPGAGHLRASRASRSRSPSSTTATSAWSGSGRPCSTTGATPTPSCTCRTPRHAQAPHPRLRQALAEALGCVGLRCETKDDVDATIEKAMAINDAPGGHRLRGRQGRAGVADGRRRHQQRRDHGRPRRAARSSTRSDLCRVG